MDENQQQTVLRSIAVSSGFAASNVSASDRGLSFKVLEDFKVYDGRISVCISWLHQERHGIEGADITVPVKLYALTLIDKFLQTSYTKLNENERLALRHAVLTAARQVAPAPVLDEGRILANKLASVLAALMVRDFPQRWTTFFQDVFMPIQNGGLWSNDNGDGVHTLGVKICLECLRLVAEDTTDSDYNAKISTARRNDVLIGLNEVSSQFLPLLFGILEHYSYLVQSKSTLHNMRTFLLSQGRSLAQMSPEEAAMYQTETSRKTQASMLINDCLITLSRFSHSMPLDWMYGTTPDFVAALLHLLREPALQVECLACLEELALRKLDSQQWMRLIQQLPVAVADANQRYTEEREELQLEKQLGGNVDSTDPLALQLPYHRALSRTLAYTISTNISHITTEKKIIGGQGDKFQALAGFLRLLVDLLHHPSGRVCGEQINTWIILLRDPQISKSSLLTPFAEELMTCYMEHVSKIRWEDVDEGTHPQSDLMEASWDDEEEYDSWSGEYRSRSTQFFKLMGNVQPQIATSVLSSRTQMMLTQYGNGAPQDHLHAGNNQLTPKSESVMQFEGLNQPLDTTLAGLPVWALKEDNDGQRSQIRSIVQASLSQMATAIVSWNPTYLWLKFRRAQMLEAMKHFWVYIPTGLNQGIEALLGYLSAEDDWSPGASKLSGEVIGLRKKSGVSLVAVSKKVPHHLVPWISQLSEAVRMHLSSSTLLPPNRMHLYEFLSCVATAVQDPVARSTFISDVLSDAISVLESADFKQSVSSPESFLAWLGITEAGSNPASATNPQHVGNVTSSFVRVFSALNQILSVGKRCHEANKKRPFGGIPLQNATASLEGPGLNFPDEGPVSLQDLVMNDPFVPLWPRILPSLLQILDVALRIWHPSFQAVLLQNPVQKYVLAISDDEAYLSKVHDTKSGGVFGEGGTAGSVVTGTDRRDQNLVPRWSGWFNELRNTCFQMLGLLCGQRALFAPELGGLYPQFVAVVANPDHIRAMENRQLAQYFKQYIEILLLSCPVTLYKTHLAPLISPLFEHMEYRLEKNWQPVLNASAESLARPLTSATCIAAASLAAQGSEEWFASYYGRAGLFVGDLDMVTAEASVDKSRVELSRTYSDVIQTALALKGDWALVLANLAREEAAAKKGDSTLKSHPNAKMGDPRVFNADGTPRKQNQASIDARKLLRINRLCHFFLLEDEQIAGHLCLSVINALSYPDAYTVRRCTRICHRLLETVAWSPNYVPLLANQMFTSAVTNVVTEPKWMVGIEWDMINVVRDIYCRLVLGQMLQPGGQGPGVQLGTDPMNPQQFEQAKTADDPLRGGGILVVPSNLPRQLFASLPGIGQAAVEQFEADLRRKRSAKDQKDFLRDLLRIAADNSHYLDKTRGDNGLFERADMKESLLNQKISAAVAVHDLPEKLVTQSMVDKKAHRRTNDGPEGLSAFAL